MHDTSNSRRPSKSGLILMVMLVTTDVPLLVFAQAESEQGTLDEIGLGGRLTRYSATSADTPVMETTRSGWVEDRRQPIDKGGINLADSCSRFFP